MEHDLRLTIFWIVHLFLLGLFGLELVFVLSTWLKARVPGVPAGASRWRKLGVVLRHGLGLVFSGRIWTLLKVLVADGLVHRRLYRTSGRRWAAHISVLGSWLLLGVLSTLTGLVVEILPLLGMAPEQVGAIPVLGNLYHADVWWVALVNEILGLLVLGGMLVILYRRYVQKDQQLRTAPMDTLVLVLMTLIALSGFPAETFRLLADYTTTAGVFAPSPTMLATGKFPLVLTDLWGPQWAFVGYQSARLLGGLGLSPYSWHVMHNVFFWLHFVIVTALLYVMPFSRFFHVIMSPVIVAYNTMTDRERRDKRKLAPAPPIHSLP